MSDDERPRPTVVALMAEHGGVYLWDRSPDRSPGDYDLDPAELGVSPGLVERLESWNSQYGRLARTDYEWPTAEQERVWQQRGLDLAYELQNELGPDVEVRYAEDGDERPVRERRGP